MPSAMPNLESNTRAAFLEAARAQPLLEGSARALVEIAEWYFRAERREVEDAGDVYSGDDWQEYLGRLQVLNHLLGGAYAWVSPTGAILWVNWACHDSACSFLFRASEEEVERVWLKVTGEHSSSRPDPIEFTVERITKRQQRAGQEVINKWISARER